MLLLAFVVIKILCISYINSCVEMQRFNWLYMPIALIAFVFCASLANIDCYEGTYKLPLAIIIVISFIMLLIIMLMLHKLPQAIENLSFKVRN